MPIHHNRYKTCAVRFDFEGFGSGRLLAVDAGAKKAGVSWWEWDYRPSEAKLVDAATLRAVDDDALPALVRNWADTLAARADGGLWAYYRVVEVPKKRRGKRRYHKDVERLLRFVDAAALEVGDWTLKLYPEEWKAGVGSTLKSGGKAPHHRRLREALTEEEAVLFDAAGPDGRDAVGIGLFALGRTGRGGIRCPSAG